VSGAKLRVGFIGLGEMGGPMASNLAKSGYETVVYDLKADAVRAVERDGARAAASVEELADQVDVLGICVVYDWQVRELLSPGGAIVRGEHDGLVVLVHSTLAPSVVREVAATAAPAGITVLDAPVSGGHQRSVDGELSVMVGGDAHAFERCRAILSAVGTSVQHVGAVGDGQVVKLANNAMLFANQMAMMEALRFADDQGVAREAVLAVVHESTGASWVADHVELIGDMEGRFRTAGSRMGKDLHLFVTAARDGGTAVPLVGLAAQLVETAFGSYWDQRWHAIPPGGRESPVA